MSQGDMIQLWKYLLLPFFLTSTLKIIILLSVSSTALPNFLYSFRSTFILYSSRKKKEKNRNSGVISTYAHFNIYLPIEMIDIFYVSKQSRSLLCTQRQLGLVSDTIKVILWNKWKGCLNVVCSFLPQKMKLPLNCVKWVSARSISLYITVIPSVSPSQTGLLLWKITILYLFTNTKEILSKTEHTVLLRLYRVCFFKLQIYSDFTPSDSLITHINHPVISMTSSYSKPPPTAFSIINIPGLHTTWGGERM